MTPDWVQHFSQSLNSIDAVRLRRFRPPAPSAESQPQRQSAVLILFAEGQHGIDVTLIERATTGGAHSGQIAFPGGGLDFEEQPSDTALREAQEEIALEPATAEVFAVLPQLWLPVSANVVTPVAAWWREPHPIYAADAREVAAVRRVPLSRLSDPANRLRTRTPSGMLLPAFEADDWLIWGFTAGVLDAVIDAVGLAQSWDVSRVRSL